MCWGSRKFMKKRDIIYPCFFILRNPFWVSSNIFLSLLNLQLISVNLHKMQNVFKTLLSKNLTQKTDYIPDDCNNDDSDADYAELVCPMDSERVMKEIQKIYRARDVGLMDAAKSISERNFRVTMPRQKITILIVGHHNTAKQQFLDLYFSDTRQTTGGGFITKINYEKMDKIHIAHGNQRRFLTGEMVLDFCPHLAQLKNVPGIKDYLTTEIASRNTKSLISFVLAPENVPSASNMPENDTVEVGNENNGSSPANTRGPSLDMRQAIDKIAEAADLIFLFFDPAGVISPKETLRPFERLWGVNHEKILLLVAKANEYESSDETREGVLRQIVGEIWRNPTVRRVGFLPEIYCPDLTSGIRNDERLWNVIQNSADQSVDKALLQLEQDAISVRNKLESARATNDAAKESKPRPIYFGLFLYFAAIVLPFLLVFTFPDESIRNMRECNIYGFWTAVHKPRLAALLLSAFVVYYVVHAFMNRKQRVLTEEQERLLIRRIQFANDALYQKDVMEKTYVGMNLN